MVTLNSNNPSKLRMRDVQVFIGFITLDASYPTGGESLDSIALGLDMVMITGGLYVYKFDRATNKLKAFKALPTYTGSSGGSADGALEDVSVAVTATDGTTPSAACTKIDVDLRLASIANNFQEILGGDGKLVEVPAATNLSAEVLSYFAIKLYE